MVTTGATANDPSNTLILELKTGKVTIRLRPDLAPKHVERVKHARRQAGLLQRPEVPSRHPGLHGPDRRPEGHRRAAARSIRISRPSSRRRAFERGTVGAARTSDPNSANSQFFICFTHAPNLNGQYTVWGQVSDGMQFVDQIAKGEPPPKPDMIVRCIWRQLRRHSNGTVRRQR